MAMIKCPECGREISDKTNTCPCCGFPLSKYNQPTMNYQPLQAMSQTGNQPILNQGNKKRFPQHNDAIPLLTFVLALTTMFIILPLFHIVALIASIAIFVLSLIAIVQQHAAYGFAIAALVISCICFLVSMF